MDSLSNIIVCLYEHMHAFNQHTNVRLWPKVASHPRLLSVSFRGIRR